MKINIKKLKINNLTEQIKLQEIKVGYRLVNNLLPNKISQQILSDSNKKSLVKKNIITIQEAK